MTRKRFRKIFGVVLIIAALITASIPTGEAVADTSASTTTDFELNGNILIKYTGTAATVSVPDTVKEISDEAFSDNATMTSVTLPSGLKKIDYAAFSGCSALKSVTIPDSVESVGTAAFCNCTSLTSVTLGSGVEELGTGVFTGCSSLSSISGNDNFICVDGAIYNSDSTCLYEVLQNAKVKRSVSSNDYVAMTSYNMPSSVTDIKPYAFYGCKNINSVSLSSFLTEIPAYSFSYCNGLTSIKIPYSVQTIDAKAFQYCVNLENVEIQDSVTYIHPTAFDGCSKLNIVADEGSYASDWFKTFDNSAVNIIDTEDNESEKEEISENNYVPKIEGQIGETVIVGRQAVFFIDNSLITVNGSDSSDTYAEIIDQMDAALLAETNGKGLSLPKFSIIDNAVAGKAFYGDTSLTTYDFPDNITSIGDFAFARSGLTEITIPDSVTSIGYGAFYHCDNLSQISVPSTVTNIEPSAFNKTRMMENWKLYGSSDFLIMGDGILVAYKGTSTKVEIPDGVKQIGPECFKNHMELMEVSFPDSLTRVCEEAFYGCSNLRTFTGGMNLNIIEDRAFYGCPVNTIRVVDTVTEIGMGAYDLDNSSLDDAYRTVVFQGDELPYCSYNKTTSRLTNSDYRIDSLEGVRVAIVNSESVNRVGTILDRDYSGFSGLICLITTPNDSYFNGTLKIIDCTLTASEAENFTVPSTVYIYGKGYNFVQDELDSVLSMAKSGAYFADKETIGETITFEGSSTEYLLNVIKDSYINEDLKEAYKRIYGDTVPANFTSYKIWLTDTDDEVKLTKFGKQTLPITIELPDNMPTTNLHVVCTDEDNQLEDLPFEVVINDGKMYVKFSISHTGNYGLYSFNSTSVSLYDLDESPDTGDYIHPKWFLAVGLFALGLVLLLIKTKKDIAN